MLQDLIDKISEIKRRLLLVVVQGVIKIVNDNGGIQSLQLDLGGGYIRDKTLRIQEYGFTSNPPPGSFGVLFSAGGNISDAVVVACDNPKYRPTGLPPGASMQYDAFGNSVYLSPAGIIIRSGAGFPITIISDTGVIVDTPVLSCTGDIIDQSGTNTHNLAAMRTLYNAHFHGGIQSGSGNTNVPDNSM